MQIFRSEICFNVSDWVLCVNDVCKYSWIFVNISPELYDALMKEGQLSQVCFPFKVCPDLISHFKLDVL